METPIVITGPAIEPVTSIEMLAHLRVSEDDTNDPISGYITDARQEIESWSNHALITQALRMTLDTWPGDDFRLRWSPIQSISSITYIDKSGTVLTVDTSVYEVDLDTGLLWLAANQSWPSVTLRPRKGVQIDYVAGYGDTAADVPGWSKRAIKLLVGHWYENREDTVLGTVARHIPMGVRSLIDLNRGY